MTISLLEVAPNYRRAAERWPGAINLARCVDAVEAAYAGNPHGAVEHVKCFVECLCLTIMHELGVEPTKDSPTTQLLTETLRSLGLSNSRTGSRLDKILSAFNKLADLLTEARNSDGPVAHGKDGFVDVLAVDHARSYVLIGNAIAGCVLSALEGTDPDIRVSREPVDRFAHMATRIDRAITVEATVETDGNTPLLIVTMRVAHNQVPTTLRIEPSRLLYGVDREAFIDLFAQAPAALVSELPDEAGDEVEVVADLARPILDPEDRHLSPQVYSGSVDFLKPHLEAFLQLQSDLRDIADALPAVLLPVIERKLGTDWRSRPPLLAGMRLELRWAMIHAGVQRNTAKHASDMLLDWLKELDLLKQAEHEGKVRMTGNEVGDE